MIIVKEVSPLCFNEVTKIASSMIESCLYPDSVLFAISYVLDSCVDSEKATATKMLYLELLSNAARYWTGYARFGWY